jgi:hypothetical protein
MKEKKYVIQILNNLVFFNVLIVRHLQEYFNFICHIIRDI